jgi:pimeloyl-ACP methyl ester carboxylesterase
MVTRFEEPSKLISADMKKMSFLLLIFSLILFSSSCSYMVKNEKHTVYSRSEYGVDKFVVVGGYNVHYVEVGEGEPVFLISGAFSTYRHWNRMIPYLSKHYKLLCIDYIGAGDSDKPVSGFGYTIEEQADLMVKMMEALQISKVHILGVSYGGAIALNLAARYPDKVDKIVSIEGNGINGNRHQKISYGPMQDFLRFPILGEIPIGLIRSGLADGFVTKSVMGKAWEDLNEPEKKEVMRIVSQSIRTASRISWLHICRTLKTSRDFTEEAKRISTPIMYLYGGNSDYYEMAKGNAEFLKAHLTDVQVVRFDDGIHDLQLQKPGDVATLVLEFLSRNGTNGRNVLSSDKKF